MPTRVGLTRAPRIGAPCRGNGPRKAGPLYLGGGGGGGRGAARKGREERDTYGGQLGA